jgi:hypothetical protein
MGNVDINELTYLINGAVFEVNRILGAGFLEKVYESDCKMGLLIIFTYPKADIKRYIL